jgi:hypothetical protein
MKRRILAPLTDAGVDVSHCSTRRFWEPEFERSDLNLAGWVKKLTGKLTIPDEYRISPAQVSVG